MTNKEIVDAISYIKSYRKLDENLHNTAPKGSMSFYATEKCLHYWDMAIKALEQEPNEDVAKEIYEDLCEYFGEAKSILNSREEFKKWLDRVKWHIRKAEELYEKYEYKQEPCEDAVSRQRDNLKCFECIHVEMCRWVDEVKQEGCEFYEEEFEELDFVQPHKSVNVKLVVSEDCISRKAAIEAFKSSKHADTSTWTTYCIEGVLEDLPSVYPEQRTGHWIKTREPNDAEPAVLWECEFCHIAFYKKTKCCPECGAKLIYEDTETWNSFHGQITAPKGTFKKIWDEAEEDQEE
jgi:hypothetical protein